MLQKPNACHGCPLWGDGKGFVPDELREIAEVCIVAQNPGGDEEAGRRVTGYAGREAVYESTTPRPLIGKTGYEMERTYLPMAGLTREQVSLCNILKCRMLVNGRRTNDMPKGKMLAEAVVHCTAAHLRIPPATRLIVAMGAHAWRYFGGLGSITDWRGFLKP